MNRSTSLYLDLVRFLAALVVFLSHAGMRRWSDGFLWQFTALGSEAVVIFFVLSGFVIAYAAREREFSAETYVTNRMARIYSVAVPALILTISLDAIGSAVSPESYDLLAKVPVWWQCVNAVLFTNQLWFQDLGIGTNGPYWSMGYEVPYYIAFGLAAFAPRFWRVIGPAVVMLVAGPNIAALFPMWLLGVGSYRFCQKRPLGVLVGFIVWALSGIGLALIVLPIHIREGLFDPTLLFRDSQSLLHFYALAGLFAANIVGFEGASPLFAKIIERAASPIRWGGQRTFALYLFHLPLIHFVVSVAPWPNSAWITRALVFVGVPALIFVLARYTEAQKDWWRKGFSVLGTRMIRPRFRRFV